MSTMDRREAWLMLAALIEGTKGEAMCSPWKPFNGLCSAASWALADGEISEEVYDGMLCQIERALEELSDQSPGGIGTPMWLDEPGDWVSGRRLSYCLRFAEET